MVSVYDKGKGMLREKLLVTGIIPFSHSHFNPLPHNLDF